ncbi:ribonuclease D [Ehrlichia ruminantium]|uniref:Ribonuclease D n=2 Tax=Ehrlichia ruminantium TaxID=779 RepID=A0A0H3M8Z4_EHRRW|nr:ribonuclease D [Ehrlichia ruminantium]CAH58427.1 putative exonuclease [Ehrlichia ruminantium str. Welgevonden]KYW91728.1 ribonuclease D [Ehrlichia ruminantium]QLK50778.1 ribonuclease D [Ehrlichia ruminantium]QLK51700.1 ribonuclease D [Ehrlichia ruminantium]QLK52623.1 ribonuclease D [Ehrlichia ruminantium]
MKSMLIDTTGKLQDVCNQLLMSCPKFIAVDTEFIRNCNEYYPRLSLIQIAWSEGKCVIDVLADDIDLSVLESIFYNKEIVKIFHDCKQDIDALLTKFPRIPYPIFDSQIAAMFCAYYDNAVGYSKLVAQFLDVSLDKLTLKRSNWLMRPLSDDKIQYALDDVVYLYELYQVLYDNLISSKRLLWFLEEMSNIVKQEASYGNIYDISDFPSEVTKDEIIISWSIVEWREKLAKYFNVNRDFVLKNKAIPYLAKDLVGKSDISILKKYIKKEYLLHDTTFDVFQIISNNQSIDVGGLSSVTSNNNKSVLNILLILLYNICYENNISQKLVCSKGSLIRFLNGKSSYVMTGWRYEFFGCKIEKFMQGKSKIIVSAQALNNQCVDIVTTLSEM